MVARCHLHGISSVRTPHRAVLNQTWLLLRYTLVDGLLNMTAVKLRSSIRSSCILEGAFYTVLLCWPDWVYLTCGSVSARSCYIMFQPLGTADYEYIMILDSWVHMSALCSHNERECSLAGKVCTVEKEEKKTRTTLFPCGCMGQ